MAFSMHSLLTYADLCTISYIPSRQTAISHWLYRYVKPFSTWLLTLECTSASLMINEIYRVMDLLSKTEALAPKVSPALVVLSLPPKCSGMQCILRTQDRVFLECMSSLTMLMSRFALLCLICTHLSVYIDRHNVPPEHMHGPTCNMLSKTWHCADLTHAATGITAALQECCLATCLQPHLYTTCTPDTLSSVHVSS